MTNDDLRAVRAMTASAGAAINLAIDILQRGVDTYSGTPVAINFERASRAVAAVLKHEEFQKLKAAGIPAGMLGHR